MKTALIALVLIAGPAMAQNGGHPNGDYGLYIGDRTAWQAEHDARAIVRDEIAKDKERDAKESAAAYAAELKRRHCLTFPTFMTCDAN
jgi:hypothetical protein